MQTDVDAVVYLMLASELVKSIRPDAILSLTRCLGCLAT